MGRRIDTLRQLVFPAALRIAEPDPEALAWDADVLQRLFAPPAPAPVQSPVPPTPPQPVAGDDDAFIAKLATLAWRLAILAPKVAGSAPGRSVQNRVDALAALLRQQEVEIIDLSGQDFDPGELWDELISGGLPDDARPYIAAMQMPRLRRHGRLLQRGVPIVRDRNEESNEGDKP